MKYKLKKQYKPGDVEDAYRDIKDPIFWTVLMITTSAIDFVQYYEPILASPKIEQFRHEVSIMGVVAEQQKDVLPIGTSESMKNAAMSLYNLNGLGEEMNKKNSTIEKYMNIPQVKNGILKYYDEVK